MRIYMQLPASEGQPLRFYHLFLHTDLIDGWSLVKESGFQGSSGRLKRDHFPDYESAESALIKSRDAQSKRGYQVVFMEGQRIPGLD
ncbi:MAG: WGR domain-containing protein [Thiomicrorhabdus sp.]|nr:WGR domain-containing protein [Thiomicrorhabdus sp.]